MLIWNSNCELDWASISNFKAPGLRIQKGNGSKLSFISDAFREYIGYFKGLASIGRMAVSPSLSSLNKDATERILLGSSPDIRQDVSVHEAQLAATASFFCMTSQE